MDLLPVLGGTVVTETPDIRGQPWESNRRRGGHWMNHMEQLQGPWDGPFKGPYDWAYSELAVYEAAIAAGTPLPAPSTLLASSTRKQSLFSVTREERDAMQQVEELRRLTRANDRMVLRHMQWCIGVDLGHLTQWARDARKDLDIADWEAAAARSTTLPRVVGRVVAK